MRVRFSEASLRGGCYWPLAMSAPTAVAQSASEGAQMARHHDVVRMSVNPAFSLLGGTSPGCRLSPNRIRLPAMEDHVVAEDRADEWKRRDGLERRTECSFGGER
jgi:hypothetical protein